MVAVPSAQIERLVNGLSSSSSEAAASAARKLKAIAEHDPSALLPFRKRLLQTAMQTTELRVRMNLILILGRMPPGGVERAATLDWIFERLADRSSLARTFALQALTDLSQHDPALRRRILPILCEASQQGTSAMRARARKLLKAVAPHPSNLIL